MPIPAGTRLGPYEVLAPLGAGGMGEVYRAKDPRLGRDVAIKVLPASFSADPDRLRRFEQEARAAGILNHPNITAVHDIGTHEGAPYVVQELLEGETLRAELVGGKLSTRRAVDYGLQVAHGLAAAHEKGIVHRDLKPENLFVTKDGRVKILDFGLAKLTHAEEGGPITSLPTATAGTEPGVVLGTLGYMSPEQVRGMPADARSDIFAFGAILYEMLSGSRPFRGGSAADTMSAILKEDPPDLSVTNQNIPPALERIVRHCLEKNSERRFRSAHDLAFDLEALSGVSTPALQAPPAVRERRPKWMLGLGGFALLLGVGLAAFLAGRRAGPPGGSRDMAFRPITYRQQPIFRAAFAPDGRTIVFSAAPEGNTPELFTLTPEYPEPRPLGVPGAHLLSVSSKGELAVLIRARYIGHRLFLGTLARMPLGGGAPREILEGVREADWSPDGENLAIIREADGKDRLEFPVGKVLCETGGYLSDLRFSPAGDRIAFFEHPFKWDDRGGVAVVDLKGKRTILAEGHWGEEGIAWSPDGKEVLYSAGTGWSSFDIHAVAVSGRRRIALRSAGGLTIQDISRQGRWLATRDNHLFQLMVMPPGGKAERDLSWLDNSYVRSVLSADGGRVLFTEHSGAFGNNYAVALRKTDGSPVVRLGEGWALDLSPDGRWALAAIPTAPDQLMLYPTGPGEPRRLEPGGIHSYNSARWFPDGRRILVCGSEARRASRCYVQDIAGGKPRPVTADGAHEGFVSPDASLLLVQGSRDEYQLYPSAGGEPRPVSSLAPEDKLVRWTADGRGVLAFRWREVPANLERVDLATGRRELFRRFAPPNLAGVLLINNAAVAGDGNVYAYSTFGYKSDLFLAEGPR
jgi:Tol biopolymer transport system component